MVKQANPDELQKLFREVPSNAAIEKYNYHRKSDAAKGAFSPEARVNLALAVKHEAEVANMDGIIMQIIYKEKRVCVKPKGKEFLPFGEFSYDTLRSLEKEANVGT